MRISALNIHLHNQLFPVLNFVEAPSAKFSPSIDREKCLWNMKTDSWVRHLSLQSCSIM